jgi:hypothetical protein
MYCITQEQKAELIMSPRANRTVIEVSRNHRDELMKLKLAIAAELGTNFSLGDFVGILTQLAQSHKQETIDIAMKRIKK